MNGGDDTMNFEEWKDIPGYEGLYQVSNTGKIKGLPRVTMQNQILKERILIPGVINSGYLQITLHKNGEHKNFLVHRLVANAFIPNPKNLPEVNHKDEDKTNCNADNLEWCTRKYNINYGTHNQRSAESRRKKV